MKTNILKPITDTELDFLDNKKITILKNKLGECTHKLENVRPQCYLDGLYALVKNNKDYHLMTEFDSVYSTELVMNLKQLKYLKSIAKKLITEVEFSTDYHSLEYHKNYENFNPIRTFGDFTIEFSGPRYEIMTITLDNQTTVGTSINWLKDLYAVIDLAI